MEKMLTRKEFASAMRVSEKTVSRWARQGKIKCSAGGNGTKDRYRIPESQVGSRKEVAR
ncbi:MAG: helix-turn-helix domain-containing protein [bacterium]|jgi:excisionase family DNA binding protein